MSVRVHNRCLYGSRLYSHVRPDSDHDYLDIVEDEDIAEIFALAQEGTGRITYRNAELDDFVFTDAFFRQRDFLFFFEDPAREESLCVLTRSHYEALIRANCLWVLEILFAPDRFKLHPEDLRERYVPDVARLQAAFKFEADFAIGKGIHFLRRGLTYKAHKNFYFAHRFAVFVKQLVEHGAIVDHEEPVRLFYLQPHTRASAVESLRAYTATVPCLAGPLRYAGMPVRVSPPWASVSTQDVREQPPTAPLLTLPGEQVIQVNNRTVEIPDGVLTRRVLLANNLSRTQFSVVRAFGAVWYLLGTAAPTPAALVG